ncbi:hypothetical protein AB3M83_04010 [Microbacterium sp. 179-B 1A2 NHS]|uniref:hypothetical protein n=1 Tax=Microbacterium sp. 179-B 1A2 NHS TaxID=3142383 RepID=UPI0039A3C8E5
MSEHEDLERLLAERGPWTAAYIDGPSDLPEPDELARRRRVGESVEGAGAPDADVTAIAEAIAAQTGMASPSTRYLLVRDGRVELDQSFAGPRHGPETFRHGPVPPLIPLLLHRSREAMSAGAGSADSADAGVDAEVSDALDHAAEESHRREGNGVREVVPLLQRAQVETLVLPDEAAASERMLDALGAPPWVAEGDDDEYAADSIGWVSAADALARAAILTGARILVTAEHLEEGEPRPDRPQREVVAVLRWPTDPYPQE